MIGIWTVPALLPERLPFPTAPDLLTARMFKPHPFPRRLAFLPGPTIAGKTGAAMAVTVTAASAAMVR